MSTLRRHLADYLELRRSLGYKLISQGRDLRSFVGFAERTGADTVTTELALDWARRPEWAQPIRWARKLSTVRGFAHYLRTIDPATEVPPPDCAADSALPASGAVPVFRGRYLQVDDRGPGIGAATAGGHDRSSHRIIGCHRHADQRGDAVGPR
jgi:Site-specific recombinase XerD